MTAKQGQLLPSLSLKEEIANAITHGIGAALAIAGLVILIVFTNIGSEPGYLVYGITLVLLYMTSTLYHALTHPGAKNLFRKFDHMAIFLLIAGTYTPYCLSAMDGWLGWTLLGIVWACAIGGVLMKCFFTGKYEWVSLTFYILSGWMAIFAVKPIYETLSTTGFVFLIVGGLAYTIGTYFYMNHKIRFNHSIWHLWVLAGSIFHFFSILTLNR